MFRPDPPPRADRGGTFFGQTPDPAKSHRYFIAAESERWDYVPSGRDEVCGLPIPPTVLAQNAVGKTRYLAYTDATFAARAFSTPSLALLGPVLRDVVGDYLVVTFLNRTAEPLSIHPHGVKYDKDREGAYYQPAPGRGAAVAPGARLTLFRHPFGAAPPRAPRPLRSARHLGLAATRGSPTIIPACRLPASGSLPKRSSIDNENRLSPLPGVS